MSDITDIYYDSDPFGVEARLRDDPDIFELRSQHDLGQHNYMADANCPDCAEYDDC